jgi:hypothetical protein
MWTVLILVPKNNEHTHNASYKFANFKQWWTSFFHALHHQGPQKEMLYIFVLKEHEYTPVKVIPTHNGKQYTQHLT